MSDRPDLTAQFDQIGATMASLAAVLGQYHRALLAESFTREEALDLVGIYAEQFVDSMLGHSS